MPASKQSLSIDEWFEICSFLSPCDLFRLSQVCQFFHSDLFSVEKSKRFWELFRTSLIHHVEGDFMAVHVKELMSDWEVKIFGELKRGEFEISSRTGLKQFLRIYLKLSYLKIYDPRVYDQDDFLIIVP